MADVALRLTIAGRVQGVGYRDWAVRQARSLGLKGWVRNRRDGTVEALAVGPDEAVQLFVQACHRGPAMARVERVALEPAQGIVGETGFEQKPTV
ncbi:MAG: acylphosphatase [Reyranellaceae bacterium]